MADYKKRFEKWQKEAKEKFEEIDDQLGLSDKLEEGVKVAKETAKKGAETLKEGAEKLKEEAEKTEVGKRAVDIVEDVYEVAEDTYETVEDTAKKTAGKAWKASEPVRDVAEDAGDKVKDVAGDASGKIRDVAEDVSEKAGEVFESATKNAGDVFENASENAGDTIKYAGQKVGEVLYSAGETAGDFLGETRKTVESTAGSISKALGLGVSWTKTLDSAVRTVRQTGEWVQEKPLQAASTGASLVVGAGLGVVVTGISSHWLLNSALPVWSVKQASKLFTNYLDDQKKFIDSGDLSEAENERIKFERDVTKYFGAPLLGAFSFASGAVMMTNVLNPKTITGAPLDWLLGGNPALEGVWFFGNGVVCFKTSYDFFMVALDDHEDVQKIVKEMKGMLPKIPQTEEATT